MIIGEDRRPAVKSALVRGHDVAQRRAVVENVVPRQRKTMGAGTIRQKKIRHQPRTILERGDVAWRDVAIRPQQIAREKVGGREDHLIGMKTLHGSIRCSDGDDIDARPAMTDVWNNFRYREAKLDF